MAPPRIDYARLGRARQREIVAYDDYQNIVGADADMLQQDPAFQKAYIAELAKRVAAKEPLTVDQPLRSSVVPFPIESPAAIGAGLALTFAVGTPLWNFKPNNMRTGATVPDAGGLFPVFIIDSFMIQGREQIAAAAGLDASSFNNNVPVPYDLDMILQNGVVRLTVRNVGTAGGVFRMTLEGTALK